MDQNRAEILAINGLSYVVADEKCLIGYLNLSGTSLEQLKNCMTNPESMPSTLGSIMDFLLQNEPYLIEFCESQNIDPNDIAKARRLFPGAIDYM